MDSDGTGPILDSARAMLRDGRLTEARGLLDRHLAINPADPIALHLRGEASYLLRDIPQAWHFYQRAATFERPCEPLETVASGAVAGDFGWFSAMLLGRFEDAWKIADRSIALRRHSAQDLDHRPRHLRPVWDGQSVVRRSVMVRCYHGLGDTIQFLRYLPMLQSSTTRVDVSIQPELLPLLATRHKIERYSSIDEEGRTDSDVEIEISDLPHIFRSTLATIPRDIPYLAAPISLQERERLRLGSIPGIKVGLAWAAGAWKPERSIPLSLLEPLAQIDGVTLFSLQRGPARCELSHTAADIRDAERDALDMAETAAIVANLDLVISVDTMVAHLAGALGAPVWLLLHHASDWRWLLDRDDSPWYPSMRIFRQSHPDHGWTDVIQALSVELRRLR